MSVMYVADMISWCPSCLRCPWYVLAIKTNCTVSKINNVYNCSGQKTPDYSWGRLSGALGNWGSGNLEGGGFGYRVGTGEVSLQATWDRGGRILSQLGGFQVSREGPKGEAKGRQRGDKGEPARGGKSKGNAPCIDVHCSCAHVYIECLKRLNDTSCAYT